MSTWLYQLTSQDWPPETFRYEIWEGKHWHWTCGKFFWRVQGEFVLHFYDAILILGYSVIQQLYKIFGECKKMFQSSVEIIC